MKDVCVVFKNGQNKGPSSHKLSAKQWYDTKGNPCEHGTYICNCEIIGLGFQANN